jgi:hypothetical protein
VSLATAQENSNSQAAAATLAVAPKVVNIWPGGAPGSEQGKQLEATLGSDPMQRIVNVTTPTLPAYLPDPTKAASTAVIIAPGGGFIFLGTDTHEVAERLLRHICADRIAAGDSLAHPRFDLRLAWGS